MNPSVLWTPVKSSLVIFYLLWPPVNYCFLWTLWIQVLSNYRTAVVIYLHHFWSCKKSTHSAVVKIPSVLHNVLVWCCQTPCLPDFVQIHDFCSSRPASCQNCHFYWTWTGLQIMCQVLQITSRQQNNTRPKVPKRYHRLQKRPPNELHMITAAVKVLADLARSK